MTADANPLAGRTPDAGRAAIRTPYAGRTPDAGLTPAATPDAGLTLDAGLTAARRVVLALGSNLGDRLANLRGGVDALCTGPGIVCAAVSGVYETAPVGGPVQGDYLNAVLLAMSALPARSILARCHAAEIAFGRVRGPVWGPRTLDVDVITVGDEISDDPELTLPHPRAFQRAFVLVPWHEVEPDARIPARGAIADLLAQTSSSGVRRLPGVHLRPRA